MYVLYNTIGALFCIQAFKQIYFSSFVTYAESAIDIANGMALADREFLQRRLKYSCTSYNEWCFFIVVLSARQSALVITVGLSYRCKTFERMLAYHMVISFV